MVIGRESFTPLMPKRTKESEVSVEFKNRTRLKSREKTRLATSKEADEERLYKVRFLYSEPNQDREVEGLRGLPEIELVLKTKSRSCCHGRTTYWIPFGV